MSQRNLLILLIAAVFSYVCYLRGEQNPFARYIASSYEVIDDTALINVPDKELYASAMNGMVSVLQHHGDEHSRFITAEDAKAFQAEMRQQFGGIGVRIRIDGEPPRPTVVGPPEAGTPAFRADIRAGDILTKIDGETTENWDMLKVISNMRGEVGESLTLSVLHKTDSQPVDIELTREIITIDSILGDRRNADGSWNFQLEDDPQIGYVRIIHFGDKTVDELVQVLEELKAKNTRALILDLRDNGGGALEAAVAISSMFLEKGAPIVETRGRNDERRSRYLATSSGPFRTQPLAVIINQYSASASEIVAACLQDHQRAIIVGQRSYGKGTVQRVLGVGSRGKNLLKLTSASYWRPSGINIHRMKDDTPADDWGVVPDEGHRVELSDEDYASYRRQRSERDVSPVANADESTSSDTEEEIALEEFIDRAFLNATEALQARLRE